MRTIILLLAFLFSATNVVAEDYGGKLVIGEQIPESLGVDLDGNRIKASDHRGKVLVISFWATWCPPCRKELPIIDNLQRLAGKDRLSVIAINFGEKRRTYKKFVNALENVNLTFTHDKSGKIGKRTYGITAIPHMVIVDHEGTIANIHTGYGAETVNNLANEINALFRKQADTL